MVERQQQQPDLFNQDPEPFNQDVVATRIALNAPEVEYEDRTSEAARDQGWGPVEIPRGPKKFAFAKRDGRRSQPRGPVRGDSEADGGADIVGRETADHLTTEDKAAGLGHIAGIRTLTRKK